MIQPSEIGTAFQQAGVGVEGCKEVVEMGKLAIKCVHLIDALYGVVVGLVVQVQAVGLDVSTKELEAVLVWLVVEFLLVQAHAFRGQSLAQFWEQ